MDAIGQAKALYAQHSLSFEQDVADYMRYGYVFSEPGRLLLGRPVIHAKGNEWLPLDTPGDAWYVHLAIGAGAIGWFVRKMPFYLPLLGWSRDFKNPSGIRFYPTGRIATLTKA